MLDAHVLRGPWDNPRVEPTPDEIRATLGRILGSPRFANAERLSRFLRYIVEQTLAGAAGELKEFVVATAVFDRDASYDPRLDAVVRVEAGRLRARLAEYYAEHGAGEPIVIHVPKGAYVPVFERRAPSPPAGPLLPVVETALAREHDRMSQRRPASPAAPAGRAFSAWWAVFGVVTVVASALAVASSRYAWPAPWSLRQTEAPSSTVLVVPFDHDRRGAEQEVSEALSRALAASDTLEVVAHSRVRDQAASGATAGQLARTFGADYTIEGRVEVRGDGLMAEVVLVDARAGRKVWVAEFTGPAAAPRAVATQAASAIAAEVGRHRAGR